MGEVLSPKALARHTDCPGWGACNSPTEGPAEGRPIPCWGVRGALPPGRGMGGVAGGAPAWAMLAEGQRWIHLFKASGVLGVIG